ncbi:MAG: T9SS type A sorting domain-containing protein, partial [Bacteroidales bacterium]
YDFKKWEGKVMNLSGKPLASVKIKVDSADWQVMVRWDNGPVLGPSNTVPFSVSPFANGERLASYGNNVPIGGNWAEYFFSFFNPEADLTGIEQMLFESVSWPAANKAYYWMDDVKFGDAVTVPALVTDITVSSETQADSVETKKSLNMKATVTPETATFTKVYWTVSDTAIASIDQDGKLTGKKVGTVTVTAWAIDGSGVHNSMDVRVYLPVSVRDLSTSPFRMYPNPASDYLHFANSGQIETVSLMSVSGQLLLKDRMNGRNSLDIRTLEKGMYLIRIIDRSGKVYVGSFMKQ